MAKEYNKIEVKDNMKVEVDVEVSEKEKVEPRKQLTKIVDTKPKKVKRSLFGRLVTGIVGPEGLPGIGAYVNEEIIKPAIKNIIVDAVTSGINMVMYGEKGGPPRGRYPHSHNRPVGGHRPTTNYNAINRQQEQPERQVVRTARNAVEDFVIVDRHDASHVLVSLTEYADMYDSVSVADYYDLIGVESKYTDNNIGWTIDSITRATIVPVRGGYIIKFPPTEVI